MVTKLNKNIYYHGDQTKQKHLLPWQSNLTKEPQSKNGRSFNNSITLHGHTRVTLVWPCTLALEIFQLSLTKIDTVSRSA